MGGESFGSELEPNLKPLGPPPWPNYLDGCSKRWWSEKQKTIGPHLEVIGPLQWWRHSYNLYTDIEWEIGPNLILTKHGPKIESVETLQWEATLKIGRHQPPERGSSCLLIKHNSEARNSVSPPPAKPPPQPPDLMKLSRLESTPTTFVCPATYCPISFCINGKTESAADDPGDFRTLLHSSVINDFKHRLEGKAVFKGLARAWIGSHVKEWSFTLPQLEESVDPLYGPLPCNVVYTDVTKSAHFWLGGREDVASIDPGNIPQLFSSEFESDLKGDDSKPTEERITIGQLVWGIVICLFKWDNRQPRKENAAENQMLETFHPNWKPAMEVSPIGYELELPSSKLQSSLPKRVTGTHSPTSELPASAKLVVVCPFLQPPPPEPPSWSPMVRVFTSPTLYTSYRFREGNLKVLLTRLLQFTEGELVFLKMRPHRQQSVFRRVNQKLAARYFRPFKILKKVGDVAFQLELPPTARIHSVFHVSLLKRAVGADKAVSVLPSELTVEEEEFVPNDLLKVVIHNVQHGGCHKVLVEWKGKPAEDATWMTCVDFKKQLPDSNLVDKVCLIGGGIVSKPFHSDGPLKVYSRRGKKQDG